MVLSTYSESPQQGKPPDSLDSTSVAVCPNSSSDPLGVLAPVLPQSWVFGSVHPQNMILHQNEVPKSWVFEIVLPQSEMYKAIVPQNEAFNSLIINCHLSDCVKNIINSPLNIGVKIFRKLAHGGEKLGWSIRILLECFQHILEMYAWSSSENHASIQLRCRLLGLMLKQSIFRKHDFAAYVCRIYQDHHNLCFWHLKIFSNDSCGYRRKEISETNRSEFYSGGKALVFSSDELSPYASADLHQCYIPEFRTLIMNILSDLQL